MKAVFVSSFFCCVALLPAFAVAEPHIFLNNVDITYVRNQQFENVESVFIDAMGNVIMRAPQYHVSQQTETGIKPAEETYVEPEGSQRPSQEALERQASTLPEGTKKVYLVANFNLVGLMGYNIDVLINGKFVTTLDQNESQTVLDVTSFLHQGKNDVQYKLTMAASAGRSSRATAEIYFSSLNKETEAQIELVGTYAKKKIADVSDNAVYQASLYKP